MLLIRDIFSVSRKGRPLVDSQEMNIASENWLGSARLMTD